MNLSRGGGGGGGDESFDLPKIVTSRQDDQVSLSDLHFTQVYEMLEKEAAHKHAYNILPTQESVDMPWGMAQATMVNRFTDVTCNELAESMF